MNTLNTIFAIWSMCAVVIIMATFLQHILRRKYGLDAGRYSDLQRKKILENFTRTLKILKVLLWLSPVLLFLVPYALHSYADANLWIAGVFMFLVITYLALEFVMIRWMITALSSQ